jgi:hypothetical protein
MEWASLGKDELGAAFQSGRGQVSVKSPAQLVFLGFTSWSSLLAIMQSAMAMAAFSLSMVACSFARSV